jgi:outer membrane protein assembly factor BamA
MTGWWPQRLHLALAMSVLAVLPAAAQTAKLNQVTVTGTDRYTAEQITEASGLAIGQEVSREDLQAAADRLAALGLFREVRYRFTRLGEAIHLEWQLEEAPLLPVSFDNFPWFTDDELIAALRGRLPLFDGRAPEVGTMLDAMARILEQELAAVGVTARVEHELMARVGEDGMMQQFRVVGPSLPVEDIQWSHPLAAEARPVRELRREIVGKPFSRFRIMQFAYDHVRPVYLAAGHLQVQIGKPLARFTGDPNQPLPNTVLAIVPIEPGPVYRWQGAEWTGNAAFGSRMLEEYLGMQPGQIADGMKLEAGWQRIRDEYARRGYLDAQVEPEPLFDEATQAVRYRVTVTEGPQYRLGQLVITGLSVRAEQIVSEAWKIPPGAVLDRLYFDQFLETLRNRKREIFGDYVVHYQEVGSYLRKNEAARTVDVLLDFK